MGRVAQDKIDQTATARLLAARHLLESSGELSAVRLLYKRKWVFYRDNDVPKILADIRREAAGIERGVIVDRANRA